MGDNVQLPHDHIDLIVTAARDWGALSRVASHAQSSSLEAAIQNALCQELGRKLRAATPHSVSATYDFQPVHTRDLIPVEVLKAIHATHFAGAIDDTLAALLQRLQTQAMYRLPGYARAPWHWTRPQHRTGPVIVIADPHDRIDLGTVVGSTLRWIRPEDADQVWETARMILVRPAAAARLSGHPRRRELHVLIQEGETQQAWQAVTVLGGAADLNQILADQVLVLAWPQCQDWLTEQITDPDPVPTPCQ